MVLLFSLQPPLLLLNLNSGLIVFIFRDNDKKYCVFYKNQTPKMATTAVTSLYMPNAVKYFLDTSQNHSGEQYMVSGTPGLDYCLLKSKL